MPVNINIADLNYILAATPAEQNIMLVGEHGIGKSRIISDYFKSRNEKVVVLFLGQMSDPGDLIGLLNKDTFTGKSVFMPPYWFPTDSQPVVLFLDELNRARPEILQSIMDLTLNRTLAGRSLPQGSRIISAVNKGDMYQLTDLDPALVSRFNIYHFRPSASEWLQWAEFAGLDPRVISFIQMHPEHLDTDQEEYQDANLDKHSDRRAWERVSTIIRGREVLSETDKKLIAGIVGVKAAVVFFESIKSGGIVSARELLIDFKRAKLKILTYEIQQFAILNENIFIYLDAADLTTVDSQIQMENLANYLKWLMDTKLKEAMAHWINIFESARYEKANLAVLNPGSRLYGLVTGFINSL
jgi:hypothetical protein